MPAPKKNKNAQGNGPVQSGKREAAQRYWAAGCYWNTTNTLGLEIDAWIKAHYPSMREFLTEIYQEKHQ